MNESRNSAPPAPSARAVARTPAAFTLALAIASIGVALWLWTHFCYFPWHPWNDVRLAPALMALAGENVFSGPDEGIITTWTYGPVPLWLWAPAGLATTAKGALLAAGFLNLAYTLGAIALVCAFWPRGGTSEPAAPGRLVALIACVALWSGAAWDFMVADNLTVALGLLSSLCLVSTRNTSVRHWAAALLCAGALGSKQTSIGLLIGQLVWLGLEFGGRATLAHLARTLTCGALLLLIVSIEFDPAGAWFVMVRLPARLPWTDEVAARLMLHWPALLLHILAPAVLLSVTRGRWLRRGHPLRLPVMVWLCTLPLSLLGLLSAGGNANALISGCLLLPPLTVYVAANWPTHRWPPLAIPIAVLAILAGRWSQVPNRPLLPRTEHFEVAADLRSSLSGEIWFSWNPTIAWYLQGRFSHAEDGLYVRNLTGFAPSPRHLAQGLPRATRHIVAAQANWGLASATIGGKVRPVRIVNTPWVIYPFPAALSSGATSTWTP